VALGAALLLPFGPASGGSSSTIETAGSTIEVEVNDPFFDPRLVNPSVGQKVHWSRGSPSREGHNVRADGELFRSGPVTPGPIDYTRRFSAGSFRYYCEIHGSPAGESERGMVGYVRAKPSVARGPSGIPFTVRWATRDTNTGSTFDVQYRIGARSWRTWKANTRSYSGVFGRDGRPVQVRAGTRYSFRARSQKDSGTSDWSPRRSFTP
jgi:plastocyanin